PPPLHDPHDLHREALAPIDPVDRISFARADAHVHHLGAQRRPVWHLAILRGDRRSNGNQCTEGNRMVVTHRSLPTPCAPCPSTGTGVPRPTIAGDSALAGRRSTSVNHHAETSRAAPWRRCFRIRQDVTRRSSIPRENPIHQLLYRRREVVRIKRVLLEPKGRVAGEHQILIYWAAVGDVLQRFLDAEAARVGEAARRVVVVVLP